MAARFKQWYLLCGEEVVEVEVEEEEEVQEEEEAERGGPSVADTGCILNKKRRKRS